MTVNEIKDMINSTISENGERGITGQALNLALNSIVDSIADAIADATANIGGGSEVVYIGTPAEGETLTVTLTDAEKAHNAAVYVKCSTAVSQGKTIPSVMLDVTKFMAFTTEVESSGICLTYPPLNTGFVTSTHPRYAEAPGLVIISDFLGSTTPFVVGEDGSVTIM